MSWVEIPKQIYDILTNDKFLAICCTETGKAYIQKFSSLSEAFKEYEAQQEGLSSITGLDVLTNLTKE